MARINATIVWQDFVKDVLPEMNPTTRTRMRLNDITAIIDARVERDAEFTSLGFVTHKAYSLLVFLEHEKYVPALSQNPHITCVIARPELAAAVSNGYGLAVVANPRLAFYELHNYLADKTEFYWHEFPNEISDQAIIHPKAYVAERNVRIGRGTIVEPGAVVLERSIIGEDVILRAGSVVGSQGFQFERIDGCVIPVSHAGGIKLGNRVEIQANSSISRPVFGGFTELGDDTKLDNLVHIAHDVKIGKRCLLAACAMIAGSVIIGDDVWIGPAASVSSEITIGERASVTIGSVVTRDVLPGQRVTGNFAIEHERFIAFLKTIR